MYTIFVRNWWRVERDHSGNKILVPDPGARKTIIGHAKTQEEARAICKQYNDTHTPGIKSRKAEYTSQ